MGSIEERDNTRRLRDDLLDGGVCENFPDNSIEVVQKAWQSLHFIRYLSHLLVNGEISVLTKTQ